MIITTEHAERVMKRCQFGARNLYSANALLAECYGTIGALVIERDQLRTELAQANARAARFEQMADKLLEKCGEIVCPHKDPMHFHHDGCPSCAMAPAQNCAG